MPIPIITLGDIIWGLILSIWVAFVTLYISKIISLKTNSYVARKSIHILGGGVVAILSPFLFSSPLVPIVASYLIMSYLLVTRKYGKFLKWFQDESNKGEVYFSFSFGTILLILWIISPEYWYTNEVWIGILPLVYMSFGDGITGIIRNYVYKRRRKGFWGSIGMLILCTTIGFYLFGIIGLISGVVATIAELSEKIDDNITVPFSSFIFLIIASKLY
ncbi:MAG: phosphatidate cytidylyltransferase [Sulfolobaceae archaeon]